MLNRVNIHPKVKCQDLGQAEAAGNFTRSLRQEGEDIIKTRIMETTRHIRSVCHIRSAGYLSRCWAPIWTELQYLSWGSLTILWLKSGRVGAEEMAPWIRALAAQVWGPEFRREKLGVVTSAYHPGLGRQTGESAELAGFVGEKELGPRFSQRPCLKGLRWRWPPLAFGGLHTHTQQQWKRDASTPWAAQLTLHLTFLLRIFFSFPGQIWSAAVDCWGVNHVWNEYRDSWVNADPASWTPCVNMAFSKLQDSLTPVALLSDPITQFGFGFSKERKP